MSDRADYDHPARPSTAQPPPVHVPGGVSVHALCISDTWRRIFGVWGLAHARRILRERQRFGLAKYGTVLQVAEPARDPVADLVEELGDCVPYAYRAKAHGVRGMRWKYWLLMWLLEATARTYARRDV